jgi:hypothetical protein
LPEATLRDPVEDWLEMLKSSSSPEEDWRKAVTRGGLILHGGKETYWLGETILAVPSWRVM